jgi:hypothetical protein
VAAPTAGCAHATVTVAAASRATSAARRMAAALAGAIAFLTVWKSTRVARDARRLRAAAAVGARESQRLRRSGVLHARAGSGFGKVAGKGWTFCADIITDTAVGDPLYCSHSVTNQRVLRMYMLQLKGRHKSSAQCKRCIAGPRWRVARWLCRRSGVRGIPRCVGVAAYCCCLAQRWDGGALCMLPRVLFYALGKCRNPRSTSTREELWAGTVLLVDEDLVSPRLLLVNRFPDNG